VSGDANLRERMCGGGGGKGGKDEGRWEGSRCVAVLRPEMYVYMYICM
jgi:hypothetical protein